MNEENNEENIVPSSIAASDDDFATQVENRLNLGLKNLWYPVVPSWMIKDSPLGITRLGEKMAIWRGRDGQIHAIEDRCPHRGARLSMGWNRGDRLACWYHGVEVNSDGQVVAVPAMDHCPMQGTKQLHSYPVQETRGAIFAYFGDDLHPQPVPLELPEEMTSEKYSSFLCTAIWKCNYRYAVDNVMDPMHGTYLHGDSHTMAWGEKKSKMKLTKTGTGYYFGKEDQSGLNFDWVEFGNTGTHWLRLSIPYRRNVGPGGDFTIVGFATPINEDTCQVYFWRIRKISGWQKDLWRFMYKNRMEGRHWEVLEQDRLILEAMDKNARHNEKLYQHDAGLARVRFERLKEGKLQVQSLMASRRAK